MRLGTTRLTGGLAAAALLVVSASPASAHGYDGRWGRRHNDGIDAGAVFGILLGVGVIAAIASANSKKKDAEQRRADTPGYGERDGDYRADDGRYADRDYNDGRGSAGLASEDQAVDACALAARDEAARGGGFADIRRITGVTPRGNGYDVTGTIDQRSSYSARDGQERSFRCAFDNGRVNDVRFGTTV